MAMEQRPATEATADARSPTPDAHSPRPEACVVRVVLHDGVLTAWVRDSGVADAVPLEPSGDPLEVHGRGLQLVQALASRRGHATDADGASVWFALDVG